MGKRKKRSNQGCGDDEGENSVHSCCVLWEGKEAVADTSKLKPN